MNLTMSDLAVIAMLIVVLIVVLTIVHRIRQAHRFARQWRDHIERTNSAKLTHPDVVQAQIDFDERRVRRQAAMEAWGKQLRGEIERPGSHIGLDGQPVLHPATDPIPAVEPVADPLVGVRELVPGAEPAPFPEGKVEVQHGLTPENPDAPKLQIEPDDRPLPDAPTGIDDTRKLDPRPIDADPLPEPFIPYRERMAGSGHGRAVSDIEKTGEGPGVVRITYGDQAPPDAPSETTQAGPEPDAPQEPTRIVLLPKPWADFKPPPGVTVVDVQPVAQIDPAPPHVEIHPVFRPLPPGFVAQAERVRGNRVKRVRGRIVSDHPKPADEAPALAPTDPETPA